MKQLERRHRAVARLLAVAAVAAVMSVASAPAYAVGAIAVNDEAGLTASETGYGVGHGATRAEAERDAMRQCKDENDSCKVAVWYKVCGAYAGNTKNYGIGFGDTEAIAKHKALSQCGDSSCRIVISDCDSDE